MHDQRSQEYENLTQSLTSLLYLRAYDNMIYLVNKYAPCEAIGEVNDQSRMEN